MSLSLTLVATIYQPTPNLCLTSAVGSMTSLLSHIKRRLSPHLEQEHARSLQLAALGVGAVEQGVAQTVDMVQDVDADPVTPMLDDLD